MAMKEIKVPPSLNLLRITFAHTTACRCYAPRTATRPTLGVLGSSLNRASQAVFLKYRNEDRSLVSDRIKRKGTVIFSPQGLEHTSTCPAVDGDGNKDLKQPSSALRRQATSRHFRPSLLPIALPHPIVQKTQ